MVYAGARHVRGIWTSSTARPVTSFGPLVISLTYPEAFGTIIVVNLAEVALAFHLTLQGTDNTVVFLVSCHAIDNALCLQVTPSSSTPRPSVSCVCPHGG